MKDGDTSEGGGTESGYSTLTKREFLGASLGAVLYGAASQTGAAEPVSSLGDDPNDPNGNGGGPPVGNGDDEPGRRTHTLTLITGHTIQVEERATEDGVERIYAVETDSAAGFTIDQRSDGTYVRPPIEDLGPEVQYYEELFFNVDLLIDQEFTDEHTDSYPVIARRSDTGFGAASAGDRSFDSIDAYTDTIPKQQDDVSTAGAQTALAGVEKIHLDRKVYEHVDSAVPHIGADQVRTDRDLTGEGVTIAVIDSGVDETHPDLEGRVIDQESFVEGEGTEDERFHGTHVAGVAAGDGTLSDGEFVGVAPEANIINAKGLNSTGTGSLSDIIAAVEYSVENNADIINMSLGGPPQDDDPLVDATEAAVDEGVVVISSAGNETFPDYESISSPATAPSAFSVGATEHEEGQLADFSAWGPSAFERATKPDIVAPGVLITGPLSTQLDQEAFEERTGIDPSGLDYISASGTSFSAPLVAGLAALALEDDSDQTPEQIRDKLASAADPTIERVDSDEIADIFQQGTGEVDAVAAFEADLQVRNSVLSFGVFDGSATAERDVTLENTGSDPIEVEVSVDAFTLDDPDAPTSDQVKIESPESLTILPGDAETVTVGIDTDDLAGINGGRLLFETEEQTYTAILSFIKEFEIIIEKRSKFEREGFGFFEPFQVDGISVDSHDGQVSKRLSLFDPWDEVIDSTTAEITFQVESAGEYSFTTRGGPITPEHIVVGSAEITESGTRVILDEEDTVPIELDTSDIDAELVGDDLSYWIWRLPETDAEDVDEEELNGWVATNTSAFEYTETIFISPFDEADNIVNIETRFQAFGDPSQPIETPIALDLHYPWTAIPEDGAVLDATGDRVGIERISYYDIRAAGTEDDALTQTDGARPAPRLRGPGLFPRSLSISSRRSVSPDLDEITYYRTDTASYDEDWRDGGGSSGFDREGIRWEAERIQPITLGEPVETELLDTTIGLTPEGGETIETEVNRAPHLPLLPEWNIPEDIFRFRAAFYADQSGSGLMFGRDPQEDTEFTPNRYEVRADGEVIGSFELPASASISFPFAFRGDEFIELDPGTELEVELEGNTLTDTVGRRTEARYSVTYQPGTANRPPQPMHVSITGTTTENSIPAGDMPVRIELDNGASDPVELTVLYSGDDEEELSSPFNDDATLGDTSNWEEASVAHYDEATDTAVVFLDSTTTEVDTDSDDRIHFAIGLTDADGNRTGVTSFNAVTLDEFTEDTFTVEAPDERIHVNDENERVTVRLPGTDEFNPQEEVDTETLRFGTYAAHQETGGVAPSSVTRRGRTDLEVTFPATEVGIDPEENPATPLLVGETEDGTRNSGGVVFTELTTDPIPREDRDRDEADDRSDRDRDEDDDRSDRGRDDEDDEEDSEGGSDRSDNGR